MKDDHQKCNYITILLIYNFDKKNMEVWKDILSSKAVDGRIAFMECN